MGGPVLFVCCYCSVAVSVSVEGSKEQTHTHNGVEVEWSRWSHCLPSVLSPSSTSCDFWWSNVNKALHNVVGQVNLPWVGAFIVIIFLHAPSLLLPVTRAWRGSPPRGRSFPRCELGKCLPSPFIFTPSLFLTPLASALRHTPVTWLGSPLFSYCFIRPFKRMLWLTWCPPDLERRRQQGSAFVGVHASDGPRFLSDWEKLFLLGIITSSSFSSVVI